MQNSASINVSGTDGQSFQPGYRSDGKNLGDKGLAGDSGGNGMNAGSITILADSIKGPLTLKVVGGAGGRGQDGGNGMKGILGANGADGDCGKPPYHNKPVVPGAQGGTGGTGGDAGAGGQGGAGGYGGIARVWTIQPIDKSQFQANVSPGAPGPNGTDGNPGEGGDGGIGGMYAYFNAGPFECVHYENFRAPDGNPGSYGYLAQTQPPALPGEPGLIEIEQVSPVDVVQTERLSHLRLLMHRATVDFLSANYDAVVYTLTWVQRITKEESGSVSPSDLSEWAQINTYANAMLGQLSAGLDYYGYPKTFVPLLTLGAFDKDARQRGDHRGSVYSVLSTRRR